ILRGFAVIASSLLFVSLSSTHARPSHSFPTRRSSDLTPPPEQVPVGRVADEGRAGVGLVVGIVLYLALILAGTTIATAVATEKRSEEHTSELQSRENLVCRLLLEKKKKQKKYHTSAQH